MRFFLQINGNRWPNCDNDIRLNKSERCIKLWPSRESSRIGSCFGVPKLTFSVKNKFKIFKLFAVEPVAVNFEYKLKFVIFILSLLSVCVFRPSREIKLLGQYTTVCNVFCILAHAIYAKIITFDWHLSTLLLCNIEHHIREWSYCRCLRLIAHHFIMQIVCCSHLKWLLWCLLMCWCCWVLALELWTLLAFWTNWCIKLCTSEV